MSALDISVIISTYNKPEWLQKVLWSYNIQTFKNFEVVIADDGSDDVTRQLIQKMKTEMNYVIKHVWHEDNGFQKTNILNKATIVSKGRYIVYTDGDCIARQDFLQTHKENRKKGYFLSGGYFKLPMTISTLISKEDIEQQLCFDIDWLKKNGIKYAFKNNKITAKGFKAKLLNTFTTTKATFDGMNVSCWKNDVINTNGFDERMQYGGEDRELGERLFNSGIKAKQIRYSAICLHLDHERDYVKPEMLEKNAQIRTITKKKKRKDTSYGIVKKMKITNEYKL